MSKFDSKFLEQMKSRLLEERARLKEELNGLNAHTEVGNSPDENAEEIEMDELSQNLIIRVKTDLAKIGAALEKIENGSYGTDDEGRQISKERLEALPWADKAI